MKMQTFVILVKKSLRINILKIQNNVELEIIVITQVNIEVLHMFLQETQFNILQKNTGCVNCFFIMPLCFLLLPICSLHGSEKDSAVTITRFSLKEVLAIFSRVLQILL